MESFKTTLSVSVQPVSLPLTIAEVKDHLNIDYDYHDMRIWSLISAATAIVEGETNRDLVTRTRVWKMKYFPCDAFALPRGPVQSIASIQYVDTSGSTQTYSSSNYSLDDATPQRVVLGYNQNWPTVRGGETDITITFVTGYTESSPLNLYEIPEAYKAAIKLLVGDMYVNAEAQTVVPGQSYQVNPTVNRLLDQYRLYYP